MTDKEFFERYGKQLNEEQLMAVKTIEGPILLLAVPGSGKTTVLVKRLGYMLFVEGIKPENILTLTYTVAATRDMERRFKELFKDPLGDSLEFRTINGICARIISYYGKLIGKKSFDLITDEKLTGKILTDLYVKHMGEYPTESDIKNIRTHITYCKNMLLTEEEIRKRGKDEGISLYEIYSGYNQRLKAESLMDYDDQMIYAYRMLKSSSVILDHYRDKYRYICVDEAQDTSKIQHMIISLLSGDKGNLFMVGDEDQSIYGFRAAYPDALLNFEKEHKGARILVMNKNYRSDARIVEIADKFIQKNFNRHEKHMCATRQAKTDISVVDLNSRKAQYKYLLEMSKNIDRQTAILYRDNESILPLVDLLERQNIPYRIKSSDMAFFTHRVVVDVINILKFCLNPMDTELFLKIYFKFQTYLSKADAEKMCYIADKNHSGILDCAEELSINKRILGNIRSLRTHFRNMRSESPSKAINRLDKYMGYGDYLRDNNMDEDKLFILDMLSRSEDSIEGFLDRLEYLRELLSLKKEDYNSKFILSTIHSSKGLEYECVVLMDVINGVFPNRIVKDFKTATPLEKREYEEERRLFYVGITRAKDKLTLLRYDDEGSLFVGEIFPKTKKARVKSEPKRENMLNKPTLLLPKKKSVSKQFKVPENLIIGERIRQPQYGDGVITDVSFDDEDLPTKFSVLFDDGSERVFTFPFAFTKGMKVI